MLKPNQPLEEAIVNHYCFNCIVSDVNNKIPIGRPWVTIISDVFSGYPLGIYIGFNHPSYKSVLLALKNAIFLKNYVKEKYTSIKSEWHAYGIPGTLIVDNGKEFHGKQFMEACLQLGIKLKCTSLSSPSPKGEVEKQFQKLSNTLSNQLSGKTIANTHTKTQGIDFEAFKEIIYKWLLDIYIHDFNKSIGGVPAEIWREFMKNTPIWIPTHHEKFLFMNGTKRRIKRDRIHFLNLYYVTPMLLKLFLKLQKSKMTNLVEIRFDPNDLSSIFVYDPIEKNFIEVPCTNQEYSKNIDYWSQKAFLENLNEKRKKIEYETRLAKIELISLIQEKVKVAQKIKRERGTGSGQSGN